MPRKPPLTLVRPDATGVEPPFTLGNPGRSLWQRIQTEYVVEDAAGTEILAQACAGADLAAQLDEEIQRDGPVLRSRGTVRANPAVKDLIAARAFVIRTLQKLGLNYEPLRSAPGRPGSGGIGWKP